MNPLMGALEVAKVIITVFVLLYAFYFLRRSEHYHDRRPWVALFFAAIFLFITELVGVLLLFNTGISSVLFYNQLQRFAEFVFLGFFLFSFIYQHQLLLRHKVIMISDLPRTTLYDRIHEPLKRWAKEAAHALGFGQDPIDKVLGRLEEEGEKRDKATSLSAKEQEIFYELRQRVGKVVAVTENLLAKYQGALETVHETVIRDELEELKMFADEMPPNRVKIERLLSKLLSDDTGVRPELSTPADQDVRHS